MIPLLTRASARAFDQRVMAAGVPGLILMENAGRGAADLLLARLPDRLARPLVIGGTGQNGGDAWVIARRLLTHGVTPRCVLAGRRDAVAGDAAINLAALEAVGGRIEVLDGGDLDAADATVVVDGLFGTGLDRAIEGWRAALVDAMNAASAPVFAIDLPSGIDADTGGVLGVAVCATLTATFAGHKRGLWQTPGRARAGEVVCLDIGVPPPASDDQLLALADAARVLPRRALDAHKGSAGHVLIVAGSPGTSGAALLCGHGALRGGAGLCTLASRAELDGRVTELMCARLDESELLPSALRAAAGKAAAVIGPGLGRDSAGLDLAVALALRLEAPAVVDADGLSAIARAGIGSLRAAAAPRVLTPHPGEAARLLGVTTAEVQADRYAAARALATRAGHVVVLKGAGTIVASPRGRLAVCPLGTPALGVAGTGDVLAGILGALLAAAEPFDAACAAVLLHARAGELAATSDRGLLAHEVADRVPRALEESRTPSSSPSSS